MSRKFFLVHLFDDFSGSPKILAQLADVLNKKNQKVTALIGSGSQGFVYESGVDTATFFYRRFNNKIMVLASYLLSQFALFFTLSSYLIKSRIKGDKTTVVVNTILPFGAAISGKLFADTVVFYSHEVSIRPRLLNRFLIAICNMTTDKVIFVSRYLEGQVGLSDNIDKHTIYNPVSAKFENFNPTKDELRNKWQKKNVVMACSLKDYKGIPEFVELAKKSFVKNMDLSFKLVINDTDDAIEDYFKKFEGYQKYVDVISRPDNLPQIFANAFMVVNLSCQQNCIETFGLTLVEGMASYCPVLGPVVGGPKEVVVHNESGYLIDSKDPILLSEIYALAEDYAKWEAMAENAKARSLSFSEIEYEAKILAIIAS